VSDVAPTLAVPGLELIARLAVHVGEAVVVGRTPAGVRRLVPILGGQLRGPGLVGAILAGGSDVQLVRPDGVAEIEARYVVELDDGARVFVHDAGVRHGPAEVMAALARGEDVDPASVYSRTRVTFETEAPQHGWLTRDLFVGTGARVADRVVLAFHRVS
jgi:hypothetical protein